MSKLYVINRDELIRWIGSPDREQGKAVNAAQAKKLMRKGSCAIIYPNHDEYDLCPIICIPDDEIADFFAFVNTYVSTHRLFSMFFRTVPLSTLETIVKQTVNVSKTPNKDLPHIAAAMSIAEAYLRLQQRVRSIDELNVSAATSTLSWAISLALGSDMIDPDLPQITSSWIQARMLLGAGMDEVRNIEILDIWRSIASAFFAENDILSQQDLISSVMRQVRRDGEISEESWKLLHAFIADWPLQFSDLRGTREDRIRSFRAALKYINIQSAQRQQEMACLCGAMLALLGDGSFQYLPLSKDLPADLSMAVIWFGLWSSLCTSTDLLTVANCLGRRLVRDASAQRSVFSRPTADIGLGELKILGPEEINSSGFKFTQSTSLEVELYPAVDIKFRLRGEAQERFRNKEIVIKEAVSELQWALDRAFQVAERVSRTLESSGQEQDTSSKARKKGRQ